MQHTSVEAWAQLVQVWLYAEWAIETDDSVLV
jgi:hypothetical protein